MALKKTRNRKKICLRKIHYIKKALMFLRASSKKFQLAQSFCAAQNIRPKCARTFRGKGIVSMEIYAATVMSYLRHDWILSSWFPIKQRYAWSFIIRALVCMESDANICI